MKQNRSKSFNKPKKSNINKYLNKSNRKIPISNSINSNRSK